MLSRRKKAEKILANYESTYSSNYSDWPQFSDKYPKYVEKPKNKVRGKVVPKSVQTLTEFKSHVPITLFYTPKEIVRTNPNDVTQSFTKPPDLALDEVRRTRPRLVISPGVAIDNIDDHKMRDLVIKDMYSSVNSLEYRPYQDTSGRVQAPLSPLPVPAEPFKFPTCRPLYVSPEWRKESGSWDRRQLRCEYDYTKKFWLSRPDPSCKACDQFEQARAQRKARRFLQTK